MYLNMHGQSIDVYLSSFIRQLYARLYIQHTHKHTSKRNVLLLVNYKQIALPVSVGHWHLNERVHKAKRIAHSFVYVFNLSYFEFVYKDSTKK